MDALSNEFGSALRAFARMIHDDCWAIAMQNINYCTNELLKLTADETQCDICIACNYDDNGNPLTFGAAREIALSETFNTALFEELIDQYKSARSTIMMLEFLDRNADTKNPLLMDVVYAALMAGYFSGQAAGISDDGIECFKKTVASKLGRQTVNGGRWSRADAIKKSLVSKAVEAWDSGSPLLHNEMADQLLRQNKEAAKVISKPVLLAALKPVAVLRGKVRGMRGIRKG